MASKASKASKSSKASKAPKGSKGPKGSKTEERNKEVTRRFSAEVWGKGDIDLADELIAKNLVDHTPFPAEKPGLKGHKQVLKMFRAAFPDLKVTVEDVVAEGDRTMLRWTGAGTHKGQLMNIPPNG